MAKIDVEEQLEFLPNHEEGNESLPKPVKTSYQSSTLMGIVIAILLLAIDISIRFRISSCNCAASESARSPYLTANGTIFELESAQAAISYSPWNLTGLYEYSATTQRMTRKQDAVVEYFGYPSPRLDQTWEDFLRHDNPAFLEHEIKPHQYLQDGQRIAEDNKIHFEPEVYHVLHCLNAVRQQVNRVLYPDVVIPEDVLRSEKVAFAAFVDNWQVLHTEHCMDRIRQDILCHADMTPSAFRYIKGVPILVSNMGERACRDWEPLRQWTRDRANTGKHGTKVDHEKLHG